MMTVVAVVVHGTQPLNFVKEWDYKMATEQKELHELQKWIDLKPEASSKNTCFAIELLVSKLEKSEIRNVTDYALKLERK